MEDSEKRKERLKAMRAMAGEKETSCCNSNAETCVVPPFLANPLLESSEIEHVPEASRATQRFDFYTDPMAAFSANKKRNAVSGNLVSRDYSTPPRNTGSAVARFSSPYQGLRYPEMSSFPGHQIQSNYLPAQGMYQPQGPFHSTTRYRCPSGIASPPMNQGTSPEVWRAPDLSGRRGSFHRGMSSPYPLHRVGPSFNPGKGRGAWLGNSPGGSRTSGFARGCGRGQGFHRHNFAPGETLVPEYLYDKSMIEDPWQHLEPVLWRGQDASVNNLNAVGSSNSWRPKSISMKRPRISESVAISSSKQSLAEYLAATFNKASDNP